MGYETHVASNGDEMLEHVDYCHNIPLTKKPVSMNNFRAYLKLRVLIKENNYALIHCHMPMGGVVGRLAAISSRKKGTTVIYTAHGFHFYKGSSIKNWLLYFPAEYLLSLFTDVLITINREDYQVTQKVKFLARRVEFVKGVGIDLKKFTPPSDSDKYRLRAKYFYDERDFIIIYVAELSNRKNQIDIIRTMVLLKDKIPNVKLLLVGQGNLKPHYDGIIRAFGLEENVQLLGYRRDIYNLMALSDMAVSTSKQEGLPVNIMEAMATGLPLVVSNCRGNRDLIKDGRNGYVFDVGDYKKAAQLIYKTYIRKNDRVYFGKNNLEDVKEFSVPNILLKMIQIYQESLH
jgi:glycosyltransferase EpsD